MHKWIAMTYIKWMVEKEPAHTHTLTGCKFQWNDKDEQRKFAAFDGGIFFKL